jgi:hypothetical protein
MSRERLYACLVRAGAIAALAGGAAAIWGYLDEPRAFFPAWLAAFYFWLAMPTGALALLLIWDLTGGRWEPFARVPLGAMAATFPLFVLLFLPVLAGLAVLYPWTRPELARSLPNHWYLNPTFFYVRAGVYFALCNGVAAWRLRRPGARAGIAPRREQWLSGICLMLLAYAVTFASIDWIMSTEPHWFSSIYGMNVGAAQFIVSLSFLLLMITLTAPRPAARSTEFSGALSRLSMILVAVVIFWAYTAFCQWLIIWEENLHTEIPWFILRWRGAWSSVIYALCGACFAVPFGCLVWTPAKRKPLLVGSVALLLLVAHMVFVWWLLLPGFRDIGFSWLDPAVMLGIGGLWLLAFAAALRLMRAAPAASEREEERLLHG